MTRYYIGDDPSTASFTATVEDPNNNVTSVEFFVESNFTGAPEEPIAFLSATTFPIDVSFTTADMAALFGVPAETFEEGDRFVFTSLVTTTDGTVYNSMVTGGEFPTPEEGSLTVEDPGTWNGGTIDQVLLQGGDTGVNFLLPANAYVVKYEAPVEE